MELNSEPTDRGSRVESVAEKFWFLSDTLLLLSTTYSYISRAMAAWLRHFVHTACHDDTTTPQLYKVARPRIVQILLLFILTQELKTSRSFSLEMSASAPRRSPKNRKATPAKRVSSAPKARSTTIQHKKKAPTSIGEAIQVGESAEGLLDVASKLWLPTDEVLAPHLRTQRVHHEKRQRWSSQLLSKLGTHGRDNITWQDDRLARAALAAALPFEDDRPDREGRYLREALCGLHALSGKSSLRATTNVHPDIGRAIGIMIQRVEGMAQDLPLPEAAETRWAARGLLTRIGMAQILGTEGGADVDCTNTQSLLAESLPNLERRVSLLPFDILPLVLNWEDVMEDLSNGKLTSTLRDAIPFQFDTIVTRSGSSVKERRGTAWVAEDGIGALAYSGKLMPPHPIPSIVGDIMRLVEKHIMQDHGPFFDCALCNHYPDGEAACKFHTDPEHGTLWERLTCVVATGDERRFAFRPIPGISTWSEWDDVKGMNTEETMPAAIHLFPGDVVKMWGTCNDDFHHAVYTADDEHVSGDGRVSLVLKRAINRGGGKRGHGLQGEGRRSRRRPHGENTA